MEKLREYLCFKTSSSSLFFPTTSFFTKLPSRLWLKAKATNKRGLVSLYKDKELCAGYGDIEIMWKIVHSTCTKNVSRNVKSKRNCYSIFCFKPV
ncbi:hypothetical protein RND81_13G066900 [Saponaria officinalis]|uniref:Uncharacterized protein n=1 Tax=Saponaria officinalis TaxID=3572 RepID=A0AAW1H0A7_SAPOF